jgi:hypothetical protein
MTALLSFNSPRSVVVRQLLLLDAVTRSMHEPNGSLPSPTSKSLDSKNFVE